MCSRFTDELAFAEARIIFPADDGCLTVMVAEKINHFEALEDGDYTMGRDPATLQFADTIVGVPVPAAGASARVSAPVSAPASASGEIEDVVPKNLLSFAAVQLKDTPGR